MGSNPILPKKLIKTNIHKIFTYAFDLRPHLYDVLELNGYFKDARLKDHCFFQGDFKDVLIYSKLMNR